MGDILVSLYINHSDVLSLSKKVLDEMGHLNFFLDKMGLDEMGLDEMGLDEMALNRIFFKVYIAKLLEATFQQYP